MDNPPQSPSRSLATTLAEHEHEHEPKIHLQPQLEATDLERQASGVSSTTAVPSKQTFPETDLAKGIVGWDGQDDPSNPQNFPEKKKWRLLLLISAFTFISPLASSMFAPAISYMAADFKETDQTILSFTVSVFLLGYAFGPCFLAPLSEIYGRRIVLSWANWFFVIWQIGCALAQNIQTEVICRFFAGIGGAGCITLGAGVIADLFPVEQRGKATAIWGMGPLLGPVLGPIAGGFIGQGAGWRWTFYVLLIAGALVAAAVEVFNQETFAPVLILRKTKKMRKELGREELRSAYETGSDEGVGKTLKEGLMRPITLFCKSPIVLLLSTYGALLYGLVYLFFTTISAVFSQQYGFSAGLSGLAFLGIGLGFISGIVFIGLTNDRMLMRSTARNKGVFEPEMRLPLMIIFACILPISFFWYGWTVDKKVHWIVPIIGMYPYGFAMMGVYMPIQTYVIDCYPRYAASANASLMATRSLLGALLPLAGPKMFESLGLGWGNSLLGFLALAFVPIPIIFTKYGKVIREKWPVNFD
ncbi:major facilitator superfamily domain-containing protein [Aspergillus karnatakaensis]|uniref:MFS transporter n=1 Tax=Aspergillus karnatakaensis TaxID=1810916 RepID=UPI003CCD1128